MLPCITAFARDNYVRGVIATTPRNRNDMLDIVLTSKLFTAVVADAFLRLVLAFYILLCQNARSLATFVESFACRELTFFRRAPFADHFIPMFAVLRSTGADLFQDAVMVLYRSSLPFSAQLFFVGLPIFLTGPALSLRITNTYSLLWWVSSSELLRKYPIAFLAVGSQACPAIFTTVRIKGLEGFVFATLLAMLVTIWHPRLRTAWSISGNGLLALFTPCFEPRFKSRLFGKFGTGLRFLTIRAAMRGSKWRVPWALPFRIPRAYLAMCIKAVFAGMVETESIGRFSLTAFGATFDFYQNRSRKSRELSSRCIGNTGAGFTALTKTESLAAIPCELIKRFNLLALGTPSGQRGFRDAIIGEHWTRPPMPRPGLFLPTLGQNFVHPFYQNGLRLSIVGTT